jgi:hypothetical protein
MGKGNTPEYQAKRVDERDGFTINVLLRDDGAFNICPDTPYQPTRMRVRRLKKGLRL